MDKTAILELLRKYKRLKTKAEFAEFLGVTPQLLSKWYKRSTFDLMLLCSKFPEVNPKWLMSGDGNMLLPEPTENLTQTVIGDNNHDNNHIDMDGDTTLAFLREQAKAKDAVIASQAAHIVSQDETIKKLLELIK